MPFQSAEHRKFAHIGLVRQSGDNSLKRRSPALVVLLNIRRGPSAILRRVITVIVDSIYRMQRRWLGAHIGKKGREILTPPLAHPDSPSTVKTVSIVPRAFTPSDDVTPRHVFDASRHSVCSVPIASDVPFQTSTRFSVSGFQVIVGNNRFASANTATFPMLNLAMPIRHWGRLDHGQASECLPHKRRPFVHVASIHN